MIKHSLHQFNVWQPRKLTKWRWIIVQLFLQFPHCSFALSSFILQIFDSLCTTTMTLTLTAFSILPIPTLMYCIPPEMQSTQPLLWQSHQQVQPTIQVAHPSFPQTASFSSLYLRPFDISSHFYSLGHHCPSSSDPCSWLVANLDRSGRRGQLVFLI